MKVFKYISYFVAFLTILCIYSWMVYHVSTGGNKLGVLRKPILKFASFPQTVTNVVNSPEVQNLHKAYFPVDSTFQPINKLHDDLFGLASFWDNSANQWEIKMLNFKNDSILYTWNFNKQDYSKYRTQYHNCLPYNSLLLEEKQLIINPVPSPNLMRLDSNSNVIWKNNELEFHHSMNKGSEGNLWLCGRDLFDDGEIYTGALVKNLTGEVISLWDNYIVNVDIETGEIILKKGVSQILLDNGYKSILYGGTDLFDPIHLNDIEPVLEDGEYWKKGDLFLSLRSRSLVFLYRPSTNRIIRLIQGPFVSQHDVDIINDHEISIFNNNHIFTRGFSTDEAYMEIDSLNSSEIIIYNFEENSFKTFRQDIFEEEGIATFTQGLSEFLGNGNTFIEEHNSGVYYVINDNEVVLRKIIPTPDSNYINMPTWTRIYESKPF